jgi:hypothetical protein
MLNDYSNIRQEKEFKIQLFVGIAVVLNVTLDFIYSLLFFSPIIISLITICLYIYINKLFYEVNYFIYILRLCFMFSVFFNLFGFGFFLIYEYLPISNDNVKYLILYIYQMLFNCFMTYYLLHFVNYILNFYFEDFFKSFFVICNDITFQIFNFSSHMIWIKYKIIWIPISLFCILLTTLFFLNNIFETTNYAKLLNNHSFLVKGSFVTDKIPSSFESPELNIDFSYNSNCGNLIIKNPNSNQSLYLNDVVVNRFYSLRLQYTTIYNGLLWEKVSNFKLTFQTIKKVLLYYIDFDEKKISELEEIIISLEKQLETEKSNVEYNDDLVSKLYINIQYLKNLKLFFHDKLSYSKNYLSQFNNDFEDVYLIIFKDLIEQFIHDNIYKYPIELPPNKSVMFNIDETCFHNKKIKQINLHYNNYNEKYLF